MATGDRAALKKYAMRLERTVRVVEEEIEKLDFTVYYSYAMVNVIAPDIAGYEPTIRVFIAMDGSTGMRLNR